MITFYIIGLCLAIITIPTIIEIFFKILINPNREISRLTNEAHTFFNNLSHLIFVYSVALLGIFGLIFLTTPKFEQEQILAGLIILTIWIVAILFLRDSLWHGLHFKWHEGHFEFSILLPFILITAGLMKESYLTILNDIQHLKIKTNKYTEQEIKRRQALGYPTTNKKQHNDEQSDNF